MPTQSGLFNAFSGSGAVRVGGGRSPLRISYVSAVEGTGVEGPIYAFALRRSFGSAVERNRSRRRIRAAIRTVESNWSSTARLVPPGGYLVRPDRRTLEMPFGSMVECLEELFNRLEMS